MNLQLTDKTALVSGSSKGIGVAIACPLATEGARVIVNGRSAETDFIARVRPSSLIQRFGTAEEVAHLVVFVCSPLASAITGAALRVDGGVVRSCF